MKIQSFFLLLFLSVTAQSQNFLSWKYNDRYFSLSAGTGSSSYFGELNYNNSIKAGLNQVNAGIEARLLNRVGARIEATYFKISGDDANAADSSFQRQRNLSFESNNFQIHFAAIYYLKPYQGDYYRRWAFDPYLIAGAGYMFYNPTATLGDERFSLREAQTEGVSYNKWVWTLPLGAGAKFKVNDFMNVNIEVLYHITFTDYLDDVSATYATEFASSTAELLSDRKEEIGVTNPEFYDQIRPGAKRGDPANNDKFLLINLKFEVFIPPGLFKR